MKNNTLDYNEVFQFMQEYGINILNQWNELIINHRWNIYTTLNGCNGIEDVKARVILAVCRPIGKGLEEKDAERELEKVNKYFVEFCKNFGSSGCFLCEKSMREFSKA